MIIRYLYRCYTVAMARWLLGDGDELVSVERALMIEDSPGSGADVATDASVLFASGVRAHIIHSSLGPGFDVHATFTNGSFVARNYLFPWVYHHLSVRRDATPAASASTTFEQHYETRRPASNGHPTDPTGCAALEYRHTWGAMLQPVASCKPPTRGENASAPSESSFALQLRAFSAAVRLHRLRAADAQVSTLISDWTLHWGGRAERAAERAALDASPAAWALDATSPRSAVRNMEVIDAIYEASGLGARPTTRVVVY